MIFHINRDCQGFRTSDWKRGSFFMRDISENQSEPYSIPVTSDYRKKSKIFEFSGKHNLGAEINERRIQLLNEPFESLDRDKAWDSPAVPSLLDEKEFLQQMRAGPT